MADITPNHVLSTDVPPEVVGRAMIARRLVMLPIECIVRGYLAGSGMEEYRKTGTVCGLALRPGILECARLEYPIFTPTSKAQIGQHDENMTFAEVTECVGEGVARELRAKSVATYARAREIAAEKGIIIADTKFEFGVSTDSGESADHPRRRSAHSRLLPVLDRRLLRTGQASAVTRQTVRARLAALAEFQLGPIRRRPPELPDDVVEKTRERYCEVYERLTGRAWQ